VLDVIDPKSFIFKVFKKLYLLSKGSITTWYNHDKKHGSKGTSWHADFFIRTNCTWCQFEINGHQD